MPKGDKTVVADDHAKSLEAERKAQEQVAADKRAAAATPVEVTGSIILPGGIKLPLSEYFDGTPVYETIPNPFLSEPWKMLRHPRVAKQARNAVTGEIINEYHYAWAVRDDPFTLSKVRAKRYIEVSVKEIDKENADAAVTLTQEGTDEGIDYYSLRLYDISDQGWKEGYEVPLTRAAIRLARTEEKIHEKITHDREGHRIPGVEAEIERGGSVRA